MKPCPFCGTMLTAALVASIIDPKQEESCPRQQTERPKTISIADVEARLLAYQMLGSLVSA